MALQDSRLRDIAVFDDGGREVGLGHSIVTGMIAEGPTGTGLRLHGRLEATWVEGVVRRWASLMTGL